MLYDVAFPLLVGAIALGFVHGIEPGHGGRSLRAMRSINPTSGSMDSPPAPWSVSDTLSAV